jgi:hypothetical protein
MLLGWSRQPYFVARELVYDPNTKRSVIVEERQVEGVAKGLMDTLANCFPVENGRKPYHYTELIIFDRQYEDPLPPLAPRTTPYVNPLRPSEMLMLILFLYGDLPITSASRGTGLSEASTKSSAAALTRKGLIHPVGKGSLIRVISRELLGEALVNRSKSSPWLERLLTDDCAVEAFKSRRLASARPA